MARSSDQTNGQNSGGVPPLRGRISRSSRSAPHPGAFLESRFLEPLGISQAELAQAIGVSRRRINELIVGKRSISTDTAIRLSRYFHTDPEFWLSLQMRWDIHQALETFIRRSRMKMQKRKSARVIERKSENSHQKTILSG
ncbi:HigA family addiction module antitoxin [Parasutterella sp.]|uniref:HigA family addiction module antitoxin n=1 Tax=Parasutterella sp. TaxID=2049037 RepID=UPI003AF0BA3A